MKPNIIEIIWHDLGDHLNCYGYESINSPNLDRFAEEGVIFDNMFCTSPGCTPSRASLMTGCYPHSSGMFGLAHHGFEYCEGQQTITHILKENGYRSLLCGVEHEFSPEALPRCKGMEDLTGLKREKLAYDEIIRNPVSNRMQDVALNACELLEKLADSEAPFYFNIGSFDVHRPFEVEGVDEVTDEEMDRIIYPHYIPDVYKAKKDYAQFVKIIENADRHLGKVFECIKNVGLEENTIIFFTTDHGAPFCRAKTTLYDPGVKVACFFKWKDRFPTGKRLRGLYSNMDIMPTLLELLDIEVPGFVQGRSFKSSLTEDEDCSRECVFCEKSYHSVYDPLRSVRNNRYKLIWNKNYEEPMPVAKAFHDVMGEDLAKRLYGEPRSEFELYDTKADPDEKNNLADSKDFHDEFEKLKKTLFDEMRSSNDPLLTGDIPHPCNA